MLVAHVVLRRRIATSLLALILYASTLHSSVEGDATGGNAPLSTETGAALSRAKLVPSAISAAEVHSQSANSGSTRSMSNNHQGRSGTVGYLANMKASLLDVSAKAELLMGSYRSAMGASTAKSGASSEKGGQTCPKGGDFGKECSGHGNCEIQEPEVKPLAGPATSDAPQTRFLDLKITRKTNKIRAQSRLLKGGSSGGGGAKAGSAPKAGKAGAKGSTKSGAVVKRCECDKGWEGKPCDVDTLAIGKKSVLDPTRINRPEEPQRPPCVGRMEDFALDDPCADPRRTRIPMAPVDPPDPGTKDEWPAWAKDTEGEEGWRKFKGNEAWARKKGGGEEQAAVFRRRRR